ncbi:MAG TPA: hypothetical protein VEF34_13150 [Syntrophobacteraceae bacterium]|nr:hypothetical protein [Syntrophobacteraceae bacterium]
MLCKHAVLRVISQQTRSQAPNRELAVERFVELMQEAVRQVPKRKKTGVGRAANVRRLEEKKRRSILKSTMSKNVRVVD